MSWPRTILHVDMDAFFASVEQLDDPALRGRPVLVGGRGPRGVVAAASYEARAFGCRSAMPSRQALALCPQAIVVRPRFERYKECSLRLRTILESCSPLVEPISIDEAFVDVTGSERLLGDGPSIARSIRERVRGELGLTCSIGVAPNKFVAKLASDLDKPDGLTVIPPDGIAERLAPLPIERIWGVGPVAAGTLRRHGISVFRDLQRADEAELAALLGEAGPQWRRLAWGLDDRPVRVDHEAVTVGHERTFGEDLRRPDQVEAELLGLAEHVAERLRRKELLARRITVKIRFGDFRTITRARTLPEPTDRSDLVRETARAIFRAWASGAFEPVRLIGCSAGGLVAGEPQLGLFDGAAQAKARTVDRVADAIRARFGGDAIGRADPSRPVRDGAEAE
jgi:DNA polymerase-4